MARIDAYYKFKIKQINDTKNYILLPLFKRGNNIILNELFAYSRDLKLKKVGPIKEMDGHINYNVKIPSFRNLDISFQLMCKKQSWGLVKCIDLKDAIIFRLDNDNIFEVFISNNNRGHAVNYLQLFTDGSFKEDVFNITRPID